MAETSLAASSKALQAPDYFTQLLPLKTEVKLMFPDMENFDIKTAGGMVLYHLHAVLSPFNELIETINSGLDVYANAYFEMARTTDKSGDYYHQNEYMFKGQIYNSRVRSLAYYSIVITLVALVEEGFNTLCRAHQLMNKHTIEFTDINGPGLDRCIKYLDVVCGIRGIKGDKDWEFITTLRDMRNKLVHNGGYIEKDSKMSKKYINSIWV